MAPKIIQQPPDAKVVDVQHVWISNATQAQILAKCVAPLGKPAQEIVGLFYGRDSLLKTQVSHGERFEFPEKAEPEFWKDLRFAIWCEPGGRRLRQLAITEQSRSGPAKASIAPTVPDTQEGSTNVGGAAVSEGPAASDGDSAKTTNGAAPDGACT